jgi:hypothetical protein
VLVRTRNKSMFIGYLSEEEMLDEHPLELADIKAGIAQRPVDPKAVASRRRTFFGVYGVLGAAMLIGIYVFVTFEKTAIETIPAAENVTVFAPLTPTPLPTPRPTSTPAPVTAVTWEGGIKNLFETKCSACHGGPSGLGGLDWARIRLRSMAGTPVPVSCRTIPTPVKSSSSSQKAIIPASSRVTSSPRFANGSKPARRRNRVRSYAVHRRDAESAEKLLRNSAHSAPLR